MNLARKIAPLWLLLALAAVSASANVPARMLWQTNAAGLWKQSGLTLRASGSAANANSVTTTLDGNALANSFGNGRWYADANLAVGNHTLSATASYTVGQFSSTATSTFTVAGTNGVTNYYDLAGNVTNRVFASGKTQALTWDGFGRLVSAVQRETNGNGFNWSADYDGLGRRLRTVNTPVVTNFVDAALTQTNDSFYDPLVEFQELAVSVNGRRTWEVLGPDLSGGYGEMQGVGGLEMTLCEGGGQTNAVVTDCFGNVLATVSGTNVIWSPVRVSGYGPVLGYQAPVLSPSVPLAETAVWRSRRIDPSGFYYLGARYYDPVAGHFLSADPLGHAASIDLYSAFGCDPVNYFDADGRCASALANYAYNGGAAAYMLRDLSSVLGQLGDSSDNTFFSWRVYNDASLLNMAADLVTPASYVHTYNSLQNRAETVMTRQYLNGSGTAWTTAQGLSSVVGDVVGYNNGFESGFGVDRQTQTLIRGVDRFSRGSLAVSQLAGTTATFGAMYNPAVTLLPQKAPPVISTTEVAAEGGPGALRRLQYREAEYHGIARRPGKSPAPINGQSALDRSAGVKTGAIEDAEGNIIKQRRIALDDNGQITIFDYQRDGFWHAWVCDWSELPNDLKTAFIKAGLAKPNGKPIL